MTCKAHLHHHSHRCPWTFLFFLHPWHHHTPHQTTPTHHTNTPHQHTTPAHHTSTPHQHSTPTHHTNTPHQHTTPTHHTNTPPIWCCGCRILAGTKLSQCHGDSFKLVGVVSPASELEMLLQCPPYLQQTNMPPTKTNISGGGTDIMTDITGSHASGGEFDEVLRLALGVPPLYEQVPQPPCSSCFPSVVTSTAAMVTLST